LRPANGQFACGRKADGLTDFDWRFA